MAPPDFELLSRTLAADLLRIGAVRLRPDAPFTWASGWRSPIYCDNRLTLGHPVVRRRISEGFAQTLAAGGIAPERIAGTATAGIPHAAWLADLLGLPMLYVRSKPKEHGRRNQIEGPLEQGDRVVLVEDLVSTGGSSLDAVSALREAGAEVMAVVAVFSYDFPDAEDAFREAGIPLFRLSNYPVLLEVALEQGAVSERDRMTLEAWRRDPAGWPLH